MVNIGLFDVLQLLNMQNATKWSVWSSGCLWCYL